MIGSRSADRCSRRMALATDTRDVAQDDSELRAQSVTGISHALHWGARFGATESHSTRPIRELYANHIVVVVSCRRILTTVAHATGVSSAESGRGAYRGIRKRRAKVIILSQNIIAILINNNCLKEKKCRVPFCRTYKVDVVLVTVIWMC